MEILVASNVTSRRTDYFIKAGRSLGLDIRFITFEALEAGLASYENTLIKLEPPVYQETDFLRYDAICASYREWLNYISGLSKPRSVRFLNTPDALLRALDKAYVKELLNVPGFRTTPLSSGNPTSFRELQELVAGQGNGVFLKPRYGSGAGGIMALKYNIRRNEWVAYTTMALRERRVCNTKHIHRLTDVSEISFLAKTVLRAGAILEEWIVKEQLYGENYDLRVVCKGTEVEYIVVRCSNGAITNLHLNNKPRYFEDLQLNTSVKEEIFRQCIEATRVLGLYYAGVDVLIARGTDTPYIIEVNGQGDHIYQDMFAENQIYTNQIKSIELLSNENR